MPFYTFYQNNSGGEFVVDVERGISHYVVIEAPDRDESIIIAEGLGLYWNGVADGIDCECCGNRWDPPWYYAGDAIPMVHSESVEKASRLSHYRFMHKGTPEVFVHYLDGRIEGFRE